MYRNKIIDMMKGIGIILVVIGHCSTNLFLNRFIYLFHLALFFVVSGYLYNEKYAEKPWDYIGKLLKSYVKMYFIYNVLLVLGRNLFIHMGILENSYSIYGYSKIITGILNSILFISNEPFAAALWFIPVLFVSLVIFNFVTHYSLKTETKKEKELIRLGIIILITIIGIYLNMKNINIGLHYQTCFVVIPFIYFGQLVKLYIQKYLKPNIKISAVLLGITLACVYKIPGQVELSINSLWNPVLFYTLSIFMIYVIYSLCEFINENDKLITNILEYIGKNTIIIMSYHILFYKLFDFIYIKLITHEYEKLGFFTCSYVNLWIIYTIVGVFGPLFINYLFNKIKKRFLEINENI